MAEVIRPEVVSPVSPRRRLERLSERGKIDVVSVVREYGPERSQRMLKAAGVKRPAKTVHKVEEFLEETVQLDTGEYVPKGVYESLSEADQAQLKAEGVQAFQATKQREYEEAKAEFGRNYIRLGTGEYVSKATYESLGSVSRDYLMLYGIQAYQTRRERLTLLGRRKEEERLETIHAISNIKLDTGEWVTKDAFESLTPEQRTQLQSVGVTEFLVEQEELQQIFLDTHVQLDTGEYISQASFDELSPETQSSLMSIGVEAFNEWQEGEKAKFEAANIELSTGGWVGKSAFEELSSDLQSKLDELGVEGFNTWQEEQRVQFELEHIELDTGEWINKEAYESLTEEQQSQLQSVGLEAFNLQQEEKKVEFEAAHVKLGDDTYVTIADFEALTPDQQTLAMEQGLTAIQEQFEATHVKLGDDTYVSKDDFESLIPEQQTLALEQGLDAVHAAFEATHIKVGDSYILKEEFEALSPEIQHVITTEGLEALSLEGLTPEEKLQKYVEWEIVPEDTVYAGTDEEGEPLYLEGAAFESMPEGIQEFIKREGFNRFKELTDATRQQARIDQATGEAAEPYADWSVEQLVATQARHWAKKKVEQQTKQDIFDELKAAGILPEDAVLATAGMGHELGAIRWMTKGEQAQFIGQSYIMAMQQTAGSVAAYDVAFGIAQGMEGDLATNIDKVVAQAQGQLDTYTIAPSPVAVSYNPDTQVTWVQIGGEWKFHDPVDIASELTAEQATAWQAGAGIDIAELASVGAIERVQELAPVVPTLNIVAMVDALGVEKTEQALVITGVGDPALIHEAVAEVAELLASRELEEVLKEPPPPIDPGLAELVAPSIVQALVTSDTASGFSAPKQPVESYFTPDGTVKAADLVSAYGEEGATQLLTDYGIANAAAIVGSGVVFLQDNIRLATGEYISRSVFQSDAFSHGYKTTLLISGSASVSLEGLLPEEQFNKYQTLGMVDEGAGYAGATEDGTFLAYTPEDMEEMERIVEEGGLREIWEKEARGFYDKGIFQDMALAMSYARKIYVPNLDPIMEQQLLQEATGELMPVPSMRHVVAELDPALAEEIQGKWDEMTESEQTAFLAQYFRPSPSKAETLRHIFLDVPIGIIPVVGTIYFWNRMSPNWRIASIALDALIVVPPIFRMARGAGMAAGTKFAIAESQAVRRTIDFLKKIGAPSVETFQPLKKAHQALSAVEDRIQALTVHQTLQTAKVNVPVLTNKVARLEIADTKALSILDDARIALKDVTASTGADLDLVKWHTKVAEAQDALNIAQKNRILSQAELTTVKGELANTVQQVTSLQEAIRVSAAPEKITPVGLAEELSKLQKARDNLIGSIKEKDIIGNLVEFERLQKELIYSLQKVDDLKDGLASARGEVATQLRIQLDDTIAATRNIGQGLEGATQDYIRSLTFKWTRGDITKKLLLQLDDVTATIRSIEGKFGRTTQIAITNRLKRAIRTLKNEQSGAAVQLRTQLEAAQDYFKSLTPKQLRTQLDDVLATAGDIEQRLAAAQWDYFQSLTKTGTIKHEGAILALGDNMTVLTEMEKLSKEVVQTTKRAYESLRDMPKKKYSKRDISRMEQQLVELSGPLAGEATTIEEVLSRMDLLTRCRELSSRITTAKLQGSSYNALQGKLAKVRENIYKIEHGSEAPGGMYQGASDLTHLKSAKKELELLKDQVLSGSKEASLVDIEAQISRISRDIERITLHTKYADILPVVESKIQHLRNQISELNKKLTQPATSPEALMGTTPAALAATREEIRILSKELLRLEVELKNIGYTFATSDLANAYREEIRLIQQIDDLWRKAEPVWPKPEPLSGPGREPPGQWRPPGGGGGGRPSAPTAPYTIIARTPHVQYLPGGMTLPSYPVPSPTRPIPILPHPPFGALLGPWGSPVVTPAEPEAPPEIEPIITEPDPDIWFPEPEREPIVKPRPIPHPEPIPITPDPEPIPEAPDTEPIPKIPEPQPIPRWDPDIEPVVVPDIEPEPVPAPVVEPGVEPAVVPETDPYDPGVEPIVEPYPIVEPEVEPVTEPDIETEIQPLPDTVVEEEIEEAIEVEPEGEVEPEVFPEVEPEVEPEVIVEPVIEDVVEPLVEPEVKPEVKALPVTSVSVATAEGLEPPREKPRPPIHEPGAGGKGPDEDEARLPSASITWKHGFAWRYIPPPYDIPRPIALPKGVTPYGAKNIYDSGPGVAKRTLQIIPEGAIPPRSISIDIGSHDVFIRYEDGRLTMEHRTGGEDTDVGGKKGIPTSGMTVRGMPRGTYPAGRTYQAEQSRVKREGSLSDALEKGTYRSAENKVRRSGKKRKGAYQGDEFDRYYLGRRLPPHLVID